MKVLDSKIDLEICSYNAVNNFILLLLNYTHTYTHTKFRYSKYKSDKQILFIK